MNTRTFVSLAGAAVLVAGCVVTSVSPFYTQKDLVFEPAIVGNWINEKNGNEFWRFDQGPDLSYRFTLVEEKKATIMEARAFKLHGQLFLDLFSLEQDIHVIPAHYLLKVSQITPALKMAELNEEWLTDLLSKNPSALRHHFIKTGDRPEDRRLVLTADTPELQAFIVKHLNAEGSWKDSFELRRDSAPVKTVQLKGQL